MKGLFGSVRLAWRAVKAFWVFPPSRLGSRSGGVRPSLIVLLAVLAVCFSLFRLPSMFSGHPDDSVPYIGLGEAAAEEMIQLLEGRGSVAIWTLPRNPRHLAMLNAFCRTMSARSKITILAEEEISPPPGTGALELSAEQCSHLLEKHPSADGVVSFAGTPLLSENGTHRPPGKQPKIVVAFGSEMRSAFRAVTGGMARSVFVRRPVPESSDGDSPTPREWFDRNFMILTPDNAKELL